jgi:phenylpropionate dioxygenase-like ring-hydroxylating dioxygenase large terminal subunit
MSRLATDLDSGLSLPASWYTDPAVAERERERIFRRAWQYIGQVAQVTKPGDFITGAAGEIPIVVVRGDDGGLRGFVNVCRHRRHEVVSGAGNKPVLQCPYHAWTYALDGRLRAAPRCEREEAFDKADYPLLDVLVDVWGPWIFVNPDMSAQPLSHFLGELPQIIAGSGLDLMRLAFHRRDTWSRRANWKVMIENFLECYHCPIQHPAFSAVITVDPDAYSLRSYQWFSSQVGSVRPTALEGRAKRAVYDARGTITQAQYHYLWPNFTISINPGHPNLSLDVWCPDGAEHTEGFSEHYFGPDVPEEWAQELIAFNDQVGAEDDRLTDSVQRGLRSGLPIQGRLLLQSEHLVAHFQKLVSSGLSS